MNSPDHSAQRTERTEPVVGSPIDSLVALARGMWTTLKHLNKRSRPSVTIEYPYRKRAPAPRYHGRHVLNFHADGLEKCIGCELCAGACPADAILVFGAQNSVEHPVAPGERYGAVYQINMLRCIFCGLCVEACPTEAITMTTFYEFASTSRDDMIYTKTELQQIPPEAERTKFGWRDQERRKK